MSQLPKFKETCARKCQREVPLRKWLLYRYWFVCVKTVADSLSRLTGMLLIIASTSD